MGDCPVLQPFLLLPAVVQPESSAQSNGCMLPALLSLPSETAYPLTFVVLRCAPQATATRRQTRSATCCSLE